MNDLYQNIRRLRQARGWTQDELAEKAGYTNRSSIAKIENGVVDLSRNKIYTFAKIFGVSPVSLMGEDSEEAEIEMMIEDIIARSSRDALIMYALRFMDEARNKRA